MTDITLIAPAAIAVTGAVLGLVQAHRLRSRARRAARPTAHSQGSFHFDDPVRVIWGNIRQRNTIYPRQR